MFRTDWSKHSDTHICNRSEQSTLVYLQLFSFSLFRAHACDFQSNYFIIHAKSNDLLLSLCPCLMIWPAIRSKDFRTISIAAPKCYKWMWYWIGNRLWLKLHSICPPKSDLLMLKTKSLNRSVTAGPTFGHSSGSVVAYKFKIKQSITMIWFNGYIKFLFSFLVLLPNVHSIVPLVLSLCEYLDESIRWESNFMWRKYM